MRRLVKLKKDYSIKFKSEIELFLDPDFVYLPVKDSFTNDINGQTVLKGQIIIQDEIHKIYSPVSGKVIKIQAMNVDSNNKKCLIIQNDFKEKEKYYTKKNITKYTKENIINQLYEYNYNYIGNILKTKKISNLIISGIEDEPYIENNSFILRKYSKEILEMTDLLSTHFDIERSMIAIKSTDTDIIENYLSVIGTYPKITISLCDDKYLLGKPFFLLESFNLTEDNSLVIDSKTLLNIYKAIKFNQVACDTFITLSGKNIEKSMVLNVKLGTLFKDVVKRYYKTIKPDSVFILNGLMTGHECDINNTIITNETLGLTIMPKTNLKEYECDSCGLCYKMCPVKVNPKKIMDTKEISQNCLDCGLCSYLCPCNINLRKFLKGEKDE